MSSDFYTTSIVPFAPIIIKICRAYTHTQEDFEDYYQEVCLQIWRSHRTFDERSAWGHMDLSRVVERLHDDEHVSCRVHLTKGGVEHRTTPPLRRG